MLNITDKKFLIEIVADGVAQAHLNCSETKLRNGWITAIAEAVAMILETPNAAFFHWNHSENTLYGCSKTGNEIFTASEDFCRFPDCEQNQSAPCHHRALSRLAKNYFELQRKPFDVVQIDFADAVFFDCELTARHKIELLNLGVAAGRAELKPLVETLEKSVEFERTEN